MILRNKEIAKLNIPEKSNIRFTESSVVERFENFLLTKGNNS